MKQTNTEPLKFAFEVLKRDKKEDFKGWDPYDGLNVPFLKINSFVFNEYIKIAITQFFKIFPVNLRPLFCMKKERNAKGIALYTKGLMNIFRSLGKKFFIEEAEKLIDWLKNNHSPYSDYFSWGYNFPWQSRNSYKPKYYPNIVTTSFVAQSFLDYYEITGNEESLEIANSSADFITEQLNIYRDKRGICFSYSPIDNERVYNANLLGAWLLSRLNQIIDSKKYNDFIGETVRFVLESQNENGSWYYGDKQNQKWIDNFHTGYNLWSLIEINKNKRIFSEDYIKKGFNYYVENLFDENFIPKYSTACKYPLDIHSHAVAIIVFLKYNKNEKARKILEITNKNMYSGKGYYYYRKYPLLINKIPYSRWSNAWMFYALTEILKYENMD